MAKWCIALIVAALAVAVVSKPAGKCHEGCDIAVIGVAAAAASASASDEHAAEVAVDGIPGQVEATILIEDSGASELGQDADILQSTFIDAGEDMEAVQLITVDSYVDAGDSLNVIASGGQASLALSSDAAAVGSGIIVALGGMVLTGQS